MPEGFPFVRGALGLPWRAPLVMFSSGSLRVKGGRLDFEAEPWHPPLASVHNVLDDWRFTLTDRDVREAEAFKFASPVVSYYDMRFVRVLTNRGGELADFLLCVGGVGPLMGEIREKNKELSAAVRGAFPEAAQARRPS